MSLPNWEEAPEGATHYLPAVTSRGWINCWYKKSDEGNWLGLPDLDHRNGFGDWFIDDCETDGFPDFLIARPTEATAWTGAGLPPAGTVCEFRHESWCEWREAKMLYVGDVYIIVSSGYSEQHYYRSDTQFRPIRTPESVAVDEREKTVNEMHDLYIEGANHRAGLYAIYDAAIAKAKGDAQ